MIVELARRRSASSGQVAAGETTIRSVEMSAFAVSIGVPVTHAAWQAPAGKLEKSTISVPAKRADVAGEQPAVDDLAAVDRLVGDLGGADAVVADLGLADRVVGDLVGARRRSAQGLPP